MRSKNFCIIPARGGSKRIPKKNIKRFCGSPIINYPIKNALESKLFEKVIVSTDSEEISQIAKSAGAIVPFRRSEELSNDFASSTAVIKDAILRLSNLISANDRICCIYPTAVFASTELIKKTFEEFCKINYPHHLITCSNYDYSIERSLKFNEKKIAILSNNSFGMERSQDLEEYFHDAGMIYWGKSRDWQFKENILDECTPFFIPRYIAHDIDTLEDWEFAEFIFKKEHEL